MATYKNVEPKIKRVLYEGSDALGEGYALCYNYDYGTAATETDDRGWRVEKPSTSNNLYFAGVALQSYAAKTGGQYIDIVEPGSFCNVYAYVDCTLGTTYATACADQYYFYTAGFQGRGTFHALQTIARGTTAGLVWGYLQDGPESGLVEQVTPANGAMTIMVAGVTHFPTTTIGTGNATFTLADGTFIGEKKGFFCAGTMTTNDIVITVTTPQIIAAVATSGYDVCTMDAAGEFLVATWSGKGWLLEGSVLA